MKFITLLFLFLIYLSCSNHPSDKNPGFNKLGLDTSADVYSVTAEDDSMNAAIFRAKITLGIFDKALEPNDTSLSDFAVKKKYPTADDGGEHMWVAVIKTVDGNYKGIVNNDAEKTTEVAYGDTVTVRKKEITDWMYLDHNVLRGGYTIRAIRNKLTKEEQIKMDRDLGFKIED